MRIGFDATILGPPARHTGGGEYASHLLRYLTRVDMDNSYVIYRSEETPPPPDLPANVHWHALPRLPLGKLSALATHLVMLPRLARQHRLDVLHAPTVHTRPSLPPVPRNLPCRLVVTVHDVIPLTFYEAMGQRLPWRMRLFYRWNLRAALKADHVLTVSETARQEIISVSNVAPERITAIYNGVEPQLGDPKEDRLFLERYRLNRPYILFVGSWEPRKNLRRLLQAYDLAVGRGLPHELVLVVERLSGHSAGVLRQASESACRERIRFIHSVDETAIWSLYRQADMLAFPSLCEGFGFPAVQAMACGTPVVASRAGAVEEVLGEAALYVDPYDVRSIAEGLVTLAADREAAGRLAEAGLHRAKRYSWEDTARRTVDVYNMAMAAGQRNTVPV